MLVLVKGFWLLNFVSMNDEVAVCRNRTEYGDGEKGSEIYGRRKKHAQRSAGNINEYVYVQPELIF